MFKFEQSTCPSCSLTLGQNCKVLLDSDWCPHRDEGTIAKDKPVCDKCGLEIDPDFVTWGERWRGRAFTCHTPPAGSWAHLASKRMPELRVPDKLQGVLGLVMAGSGCAHAQRPSTILAVACFGSNASGSNEP